MQDKLHRYFVDLHIHLGSTNTGKPVKITASKNLTLENVIIEARDRKGMNMIGVIDCHVPEVLLQLRRWQKEGNLIEGEEGGLHFQELTLILGSELEIYDENCSGPIHVLIYIPTIEGMWQFSNWLSERLKNITLSSQRVYENAQVIQEKVKELKGLFIPAHIFTPFKSMFGRGVRKEITEVFNPELIDGVELGLSSNTEMASSISQLNGYTFLTNSDAHSLQKIGREYQVMQMASPSFEELRKILHNMDGRKVLTNYGLNPYLGKYYKTACEKCFSHKENGVIQCANCGHERFVKGVSSRIDELSDQPTKLENRPPYIHQVPLDFIPGVGPRTLLKLRETFHTEMNVLHYTTKDQLSEVVGEKIANLIDGARKGTLQYHAGGAGKFGKVSPDK
nr:endonuclease Q family protein [Bacillus sp. FJAT-45066]